MPLMALDTLDRVFNFIKRINGMLETFQKMKEAGDIGRRRRHEGSRR